MNKLGKTDFDDQVIFTVTDYWLMNNHVCLCNDGHVCPVVWLFIPELWLFTLSKRQWSKSFQVLHDDLHWATYFYIYIIDCIYIVLFSALEQTRCARMWFYMSEYLFIVRFLNIHWSGVLTALVWLVPQETAAISAHSVDTMQPCTMSLHAKPHT